ncbi:MAG: hypothetical protein HYS27_18225 [Deltaproteobacteria bacterium]|nr:hypothetical protein [Deltaproteobacteria bacterium]
MPRSTIALALLSLTLGCATSSGAPPADAPTAPTHVVTAEEQAAFLAAKAVFTARCLACHSRTGARRGPRALRHLDMTSYPFAGRHAAQAGAAVREALTGKKPSMPKGKPGSLTAEELALLLAWADAFDRGPAAPSMKPAERADAPPLDAGPGSGG